jgi:hypothetical protein
MNTKALLLSLGNAALYLVACAMIGTGLLLEWRMDEEGGAARLLGMGPDDWAETHFIIAIAFIALTVLHLLLNWAWIKAAMTKTKWAVPMLVVGLGLITALLLWPADRNASPGGKNPEHRQHDSD